MYRIAVLGDRDSIYGFATLGLDIFPVSNQQEAVKQLKTLSDGAYAVVYITEQMASLLENEIDYLSKFPLPAIIPIPGLNGNTGMGIKMVKKSVEKAVGSDIIFGNE